MQPILLHRLPVTVVMLVGAVLSAAAKAQVTSTWTGCGSDSNWSTSGNRSGAGVPSGDSGNNVAVFAGTTRTSTVNDLGDWTRSFGQLSFASSAGSFTLSGDTFGFRPYLGRGLQQIFQDSANTQTIGVPRFSFRPGADSRINLNAGDLVISAPDFFIDSATSVRSLVVTGSDSTRRTVTFGGNVNKGGTDQDPDLYIQGNKRALVTGSLAFGSGADGGNLSFAGSTSLALSFNSSGSSVVWVDPFRDGDRSWMVYDLSSGSAGGLSNLVLGGSLLDSLNQALSPTERGFLRPRSRART